MYRVMGTLYILAPLLRKSTHTNHSNRNLPFWRPFTCWRPYAEKARITYASYVCQAAGTSIIGGGASSWIAEIHYYYGDRRLQARSGRWHISVDPASPFRKFGREPTFVLRHGGTSPHLEPGHVASGQEASVSPDRLCGTPCPKTLQIKNCHWNISRLNWKLIYFVWHMPSSAHSAYVTWLRGA